MSQHGQDTGSRPPSARSVDSPRTGTLLVVYVAQLALNLYLKWNQMRHHKLLILILFHQVTDVINLHQCENEFSFVVHSTLQSGCQSFPSCSQYFSCLVFCASSTKSAASLPNVKPVPMMMRTARRKYFMIQTANCRSVCKDNHQPNRKDRNTNCEKTHSTG